MSGLDDKIDRWYDEKCGGPMSHTPERNEVAEFARKFRDAAVGMGYKMEGNAIVAHPDPLRDELVAMLRRLDRVGVGHDKELGEYRYCTFCQAGHRQDHFEDCEYMTLLKKAGG